MNSIISNRPGRPSPRTRIGIPSLGFVGVGWIGRNRLDALAQSRVATVAAIADPSGEARAALRSAYPDAAYGTTINDVLEAYVDGVVIASPSALHGDQAMAALQRGFAVFCQKPLGRTATEVCAVVEAARRADRLLGVDMSYRHTAAMLALRERIRAGDIGDVYAAELVFHNAYGPDKEWFYDHARSGGGCVMDLGIHLVDLALWIMEGSVDRVEAALFARGRRLEPPAPASPAPVEDYAEARLELDGGRTVRLACSWNLHAGRDAVIEARFHGTEGGAIMRNLDGSFYDFCAELYRGTVTETLVEPPDAWGGRAAVAWARRLAEDRSYDSAAEELVTVAEVLDRIYRR